MSGWAKAAGDDQPRPTIMRAVEYFSPCGSLPDSCREIFVSYRIEQRLVGGS